MPLYDFECRACQHRYEAMGRYGEANPPCPECGSQDIEKIPSMGTIGTKVPDKFTWENPRYRGVNSTIKKNPNFGKD